MSPRALRAVGPALLVVFAFAALLVALAYGGGAAPLQLLDPGPAVRWGLPIAKLVVNLSIALTVGPLVLALFALKPGQRAFELCLDLTSGAAAVLTIAAAATGFTTFLNAFPSEVSLGAEFGSQLGSFLTTTEIGRAWLITTLGAALLTVMTFMVRGWLGTLFAAGIAIALIVPMATAGHKGDLANHNIAVSSIFLHMLAAAVWLGGLIALVMIRGELRKRLSDVLARYSSLALASFIVIAGSGVARSIVGVGTWEQLFTPYGLLIVAKTVLLVLLGVAGAMYRGKLIAAAGDAKRGKPFWRLITVELAIMGLASGVAAALARTPPPTGADAVVPQTPAESLTRRAMPPELTFDRWFTEWYVDILWAFAVAFGLFFYLAGVARLRKRGDRWPVHRTIFWIAGLALLFWVTCGPVNAYQEYLFSVHMLGHMLLAMAIPLLLVVGSPVTLALRAIRKRTDGTRGGREWILWAVHSPYSRFITHPIVAAAIFVSSLWIFYYTDLFRWSLYDHLGHEWMVIHFLISGYLFVLSLIGADPIPFRFPYPGRLITLIAVAAMHAFFGIAIMMQTGLMVAEWYGSMGRTWGDAPLQDQYVGGGIAWSIGEIPTLILAITLGIQWSRNDERQQRNRDRHADRTGDAELEEYNARLAELAEQDTRRGN